MTASSPPIPQTANRSIQLLFDLRRTCADFAKQEEALVLELSSKRQTLERKSQQQQSALESHISMRTGNITTAFDTQENYVRAAFAERRSRVERVAQQAQRTLIKRAKDVRTSWLGSLTMRQHRLQQKLVLDQQAARGLAGRLETFRHRLETVERSAKAVFGGYGSLQRQLRRNLKTVPEAISDDEAVRSVEEHLQTAEKELGILKGIALLKFFRSMHPFPLVISGLVLGAMISSYLNTPPSSLIIGGSVAGGITLLVLVLHAIGRSQARASSTALIAAVREVRRIFKLAAPSEEFVNAAARQQQQLQQEFDLAMVELEEQRGQADAVEASFLERQKEKLRTQPPRLLAKIDSVVQERLESITRNRTEQLNRVALDETDKRVGLDESSSHEWEAFSALEQEKWAALRQRWEEAITPLFRQASELASTPAATFPDWSARFIENWTTPEEFPPAIRLGRLQLDLTREAHPRHPQMPFPGPSEVTLPLSLCWPEQGSVLLESEATADNNIVGTLQNVMLRLFASSPPGKVAMTILDPVGLGQSFAGLMHLTDYEESLISRRIWTQRDQIDERLAELNEHIEKVIQMYLRNEYTSIMEYNERAGSVAEKYHFLVVADFPEGFSETAVRRLQSIAVSGPRCGVFTLLHWNKRTPLPDGILADDLKRSSVCLRRQGQNIFLEGEKTTATLKLDEPPTPDLAATLVHKIGKSSVDSNRVVVPFSQIAPTQEERWTGDTTQELRIAIGRTGATKLQYLAIGKGTRQHALFAGKTGSGKSTLFHVIITNLALTCSPDQVEFYLIDFKKGVEFKSYATQRLPHARVIAIESDREFGLSVLQRVDEELRRRGDIFRKLGVQDIPGYRKVAGREPMPRTLLIIDEFQEFYTEDDQIAQTASLLFDRIVRQGRAFGIHVLLGSQTLGGAYTLARATLGQMVIRVALQCNEADSYLIMDESNAAPRLLTRPGEGIYNDSAGAVEGNSPFQVVWIDDDEREAQLKVVRHLADTQHDKHATPIVFEGNAPAEIRENTPLARQLDAKPTQMPATPRVWLGAPNSIKGPTEVVFHRQSGNHLLIVGQSEESSLTMVGLSILALAAQHPQNGAQFYVLHASVPGSADEAFLKTIAASVPQEIKLVTAAEVPATMPPLAEEQARRASEGATPETPNVFVFILGLQRFKKLRNEDEFSFSMSDSEANPATQFNALISEGSTVGLHLIVTLDTYNNTSRFLSRKALTEFEMRVVFQMSANDSASLIDSPKAGNLGMHRALLHNEQAGTLETFRPYALPDTGWIQEIRGKLERS